MLSLQHLQGEPPRRFSLIALSGQASTHSPQPLQASASTTKARLFPCTNDRNLCRGVNSARSAIVRGRISNTL